MKCISISVETLELCILQCASDEPDDTIATFPCYYSSYQWTSCLLVNRLLWLHQHTGHGKLKDKKSVLYVSYCLASSREFKYYIKFLKLISAVSSPPPPIAPSSLSSFRVDTTRVEFTISLRENWSLPFFALQVTAITCYLRPQLTSLQQVDTNQTADHPLPHTVDRPWLWTSSLSVQWCAVRWHSRNDSICCQYPVQECDPGVFVCVRVSLLRKWWCGWCTWWRSASVWRGSSTNSSYLFKPSSYTRWTVLTS